jgi:hypothetical protein
VSLIKTGPSASEKSSLGDRARGLAAQAVPQASRAGTTAVQGVMQGVHGARGWAAPRMHSAADAVTESLAPRVSSALHSAAKTVDTAPPPKSGIRRLLDWRLLLGIGAALAAAGAAAAVSMRRYQTATADARDGADSLADESDDAQRSSGAHRNPEAAPAAADRLKAAAGKISAAADKVREAAHR